MTRSNLIVEIPARRVKLASQLGLFDATMMVMGGIVGAGIFMNPYVVAQRLHSPLGAEQLDTDEKNSWSLQRNADRS